ncbi:hypothetical protein C8Q79DRAFT_965372, partial [Trametes meyenii]
MLRPKYSSRYAHIPTSPDEPRTHPVLAPSFHLVPFINHPLRLSQRPHPPSPHTR